MYSHILATLKSNSVNHIIMTKTIHSAGDPPKVTEHPKSQAVPTGEEATFKIEASGDDLIFQWQKNGSNLKNDINYSGADTNTLTIQHVKKSRAGYYRCLVMNEVNKDGEISEEAKLTICESVLQCLFLNKNYLRDKF